MQVAKNANRRSQASHQAGITDTRTVIAQLCFACRSRAKVNSSRWQTVGETRAYRSLAGGHPFMVIC